MEAALPHFHRLATSRFYQQYAAPPVRISSNYLHDLIPQQHPTLLQQYLAYYNEPLVPLDLSLKSTTPITPPCTPPPSQKRKSPDVNKNDKPIKIFRHFEETDINVNEELQEKTQKRKTDDEISNDSDSPEAKKLKFTKQFFEELRSCLPNKGGAESERSSPDVVEIKDVEERPKKSPKPQQPLKKSKVVRRLMFDEDKTSPVSGTIIRDLAEDETLVVRKGDIDPAFNVVEVTEEAKALIATIDNKLGRYICRLCRRLYSDAFALAQHRCSRIVHIEYRCPECDKVFNCPANLASHRRWHKPRVPGGSKRREPSTSDAGRFPCQKCGKLFRRQAYLRKHLLAHEQPDTESEKEPSAFRQVHVDYSTYQSQEPTRDSNFNTFWNKMPLVEPTWEESRNRCPSNCSSEDSRSLDVTGSEDEGGGMQEGRDG
nr:zinc finger protein 200-like [Vanessa tameamea]